MLTDKQIKAAKPGEKPIRLWDQRGLYIEISTTGAKLWRWKFRFKGKERRLALGQYPAFSLREAREKAEDARRLLQRGEDPCAVKQAAKAATRNEDTFEYLARKWHEREASELTEDTAQRTLRRLEANVFPYVRDKRPDEISALDWLAILQRVGDRGAIETMHRIRASCAAVYRYARIVKRATTYPLDDLVGALPTATVKHFASKTEPRDIRPILLAIRGYVGTPIVRVALELAPLLFVRPGELRAMKWAEVDLDAAEWRYIVPKTGTPHIVPLSKQARALLEELKPLTGAGEFVFPSTRGKDRPMSNNTLNAALQRLGVDTQNDLTTHGWRAAARTMLDEQLGFRVEVIEMQLAHSVRDPLGTAYNRTKFLEERKRMMQAWADFLDDVRKEKAA